MTTSSLPGHEWLDREIAARAETTPLLHVPGRFCVLTTVYERTDTDLFRETAASLMQQVVPFDRWVVLAHGPIGEALDAALASLATDPRVCVLREKVNLGIMGGMRLCLEAADGDYVVPMDADDLLTPDALQVMSAAIEAHARPAFLYSDECMLVDGVPMAPYRRPDWDPVLNLASSYIWHLCAIRRDIALTLDLYTDEGATWCHDWDTVFRVTAAGEVPVHVPQVLYLWRQHPASTTHQPDVAPGALSGSRRSTRHLLERFLASRPHRERYTIVDFPIFRGADEWYVVRRPVDPPAVACVLLGGSPTRADVGPVATRHCLGPGPEDSLLRRLMGAVGRRQDVAALKQIVGRVTEKLVLFISGGVHPPGDDWWWEAVKLFELHPQAAVVSGLLTDASGRVRRGIERPGLEDNPAGLQAGNAANAPGPFAIWLKPQCVGAVPTDLFFARTGFLRAALAELPDDARLAGLGLHLAQAAARQGRIAAYSPLIRATATGRLIDGPPDAAAHRGSAWRPAAPVPEAARRVPGEAMGDLH
jgi:hypothetical protein